MKIFGFQPSLRGKIALAYAAIAFLTLMLAVFAYGELRLLREGILRGERVTELFDTAMEIRRFERNFFLHGEDADYRENAAYTEKLLRLLERNQGDFVTLGLGGILPELRAEIDGYRQLMDEYVAANGRDMEQRRIEPRIRAAGKGILAASEAVVAAERQTVRGALSSFQNILVFSVACVVLLVFVVGQALTRRVVQPLKQIEKNVDAVASGSLRALEMPGNDREIVSIVNAFNQMLRELELRRRHLLRSEKLASIGTMVSGVAHELNNPLSNIWSSCQLLLEDPALPADSPLRELLQQIDDQSIRARNIVRALLEFSRDREFRRERVSLNELMQQTLRFLRGDMPPDLAVTVDVPAGLTVMADRQRLQQALLNLIKNAVDACGEAEGACGIRIQALPRAAADIAADDEGMEACRGMAAVDIRVSDDGPGIAAEILPRIFDPFYTTKDVGKGMGLGLFIVYQIVEEHGGCIVARSEPGCGASFLMRLPDTDGKV